jgi:hypothetical protein
MCYNTFLFWIENYKIIFLIFLKIFEAWLGVDLLQLLKGVAENVTLDNYFSSTNNIALRKVVYLLSMERCFGASQQK